MSSNDELSSFAAANATNDGSVAGGLTRAGGNEEAVSAAEEFDGDTPLGGRGAAAPVAVVAVPSSNSFGLPGDLSSVESHHHTLDEFEAAPGDVTRAVATLHPSTAALPGKSGLALHGRKFDASGARVGFAPAPSLQVHGPDAVKAPPLPPYLRVAPTAFRSKKPLPALTRDLRHAFGALAVHAEPGVGPAVWACTVERSLARVHFEVRIFVTGVSLAHPPQQQQHLVEVRPLAGCPYAFAEAAAELSAALRVGFDHGVRLPMPRAPPPLSDDAVRELHALHPSPTPVDRVDGLGSDAEAQTAAHIMALLAPSASAADHMAGCRACGGLAHELASRMGSCGHRSSCGANHRGHQALFAPGGAWLGLAERVQALAADGASPDAVRSAALGAVANVAVLEHVCGAWLAEAVRTASGAVVDAAAGVEAGAAWTDDVHVKREALRCASALAERDAKLARQLAAVEGYLATLELEASGEHSTDARAQRFAQCALNAVARA